MRTVAEAREDVLAAARAAFSERGSGERVELHSALGRITAEEVAADLDSPPFDKALMDGYALRAADCATPPTSLLVVGTTAAGDPPPPPLEYGACRAIMTGAPLPPGADAVIPRERLAPPSRDAAGQSRLTVPFAPPAESHLLRRGASARGGQAVLPSGTRLGPAHLGIAAEAGRGTLRVHRRPTVAIVATGNELVPPEVVPGPGQIRNSNAAMAAAFVLAAGAEVLHCMTVPDDPDLLRAALAAGLSADVLLTTGGVSAGDLDFVPGLLLELGVERHFHSVRMRPGKPLWFGDLARPGGRTLVFGLPGNPLSTLACAVLFVQPALRILGGAAVPGPPTTQAAMRRDFATDVDRETYFPARLSGPPEALEVDPLPWLGSADLFGIGRGNCFVRLAQGSPPVRAGESVTVLPWGD